MLLSQPWCPEAACVWAGDLNSLRGSDPPCSVPCSPGGPPYNKGLHPLALGALLPLHRLPQQPPLPPRRLLFLAGRVGGGRELQVLLGFAALTHPQRSVPLVFPRSSLLLSFVPVPSDALGSVQEACGPAAVSGFHQLRFKEWGGDLGSWEAPLLF